MTLKVIHQCCNFFRISDFSTEANGIDLVENDYQIESVESNPSLNFSTNSLSLLISKHARATESVQEDTLEQVGGKRSDFKMNTCSLHSSGALLLEDRDRLLLKVLPSDANTAKNVTNNGSGIGIGGSSHDQSNHEISQQDAPISFNSDDDDDVAEQPIFDIFTEQQQDQETLNGISEIGAQDHVSFVRQSKRTKKKVREEEQWEILDPHNDSPPKLFSIRPFKQGSFVLICVDFRRQDI